MSKNINIAPSYCPKAKATKRGWEDPETGELLVSNKSLDLELINSGVSLNDVVSANVETTTKDETLYDELVEMNKELEELVEMNKELEEEPVELAEKTEEKINLSTMNKTEIIAYAENVLDLELSMDDTKKSLIEQIKNQK